MGFPPPTRRSAWRHARPMLLACMVLNSVLYSLLLPLWEGFGELFHFAYVQQLANARGLPDPRTARLSSEVAEAFRLAPGSYVVRQNFPEVTTYAGYFAWPSGKKAEIRHRLWQIPPHLRWQASEYSNYEAHHPPLAYLVLALPERILAPVALPMRVALLRIFAALSGAWLLWAGAELLFTQLSLSDSFQIMALFCLFSSQMMWATLAHVANDWLAVPLAVWVLVALNRFAARPSLGNGVVAILALAAGLLTKAYFLALVPLVAGLFLWRRAWRHLALAALLLCGLAGPWYARNLLRYGALSGTQEARAGIGVPAVSRSVTTVNWRGSILPDIRAGLWSGNNSSLTFSAHTLNLIIGVGAAALLLWAAGRHSAAEWITLAFCLLFILALGYATVASHIYTQGAANGPGPWYAQVLLAPVLGLMFLGTYRWGKFGRCLAALLVILFGYVLAATYVLKLIPLYGGYEGSARAGDLAQLYGREFSRLAANLDTVALAPAPIIFALALMVVGIVIAEEVLLISCLMRSAR